MSSSEPLRTRALARALTLKGIGLIDAPVSGGVAGATKGTLTVMVGGAEKDVDELRPLLEAFGKVVLAGPVGSGHAVKALNNLLSATHLLVTSEAMLAGGAFRDLIPRSCWTFSTGRVGGVVPRRTNGLTSYFPKRSIRALDFGSC